MITPPPLRRGNPYRTLAATLVAAGVVVAAAVFATSAFSTTDTRSTCVEIAGYPGPSFLRVISDSNRTPVVSADVTATTQYITASCNGRSALATSQIRVTFTTNHTEWYLLSGQNNWGFSILVTYSGRSYNFTAGFAPLSVTCATLYVPSGRANVTITELQSTCPPSIPGTSSG